MKKFLSILLPIVMVVLMLFPFCISADNSTSASLQVSGVVYPGNIITITLNVTGKEVAGISGNAISNGYDSSKMELLGTPTTPIEKWKYRAGEKNFMLINDYSTETYNFNNQVVLSMRFKINKNAKIGDTIYFKIPELEIVAKEAFSKDLYKTLKVVERPKETNNKLKSLETPGFEIQPKFSPSIENYTLTVHNKVTEIPVTAVCESGRATFKTEGNTNFKVGKNDVTVTVTAENGSKRVYTIVVTRKEPPSTNPNLSGMTVKEGALTPAFSENVAEYSIRVPAHILSLNFQIQTKDANAKYEIAGNSDFAVGMNRVTVLVTAEDGITTKIYTVLVERERPIETDSKASGIFFGSYTITPEFDANKEQEYQLTIPYIIADLKDLQVTTSGKYAKVQIEGGDALTVGINEVKITVTSEDQKNTSVYILKVTREPRILSGNGLLSSLQSDSGSLLPAFDPEIKVYTMVSAPGLSTIGISAIPADHAATAESKIFNLTVGLNTLNILCKAENGHEEIYTVYVFVPEQILQLKGTPMVGKELKAEYNGENPDGIYTWYVDDVVLKGVKGSSCTLMPDHAGKNIRVTYQDQNGTVQSASLFVKEGTNPIAQRGISGTAGLVILVSSTIASLVIGGCIGFFFTRRKYHNG